MSNGTKWLGGGIDLTPHYIVDEDAVGATSVSNRQYEEIQNELKRRIKIVPSSVISVILKNFKDQI